MYRYLIESPHTDEECLEIVKQVIASGYTTHFDWGCRAGSHKGWVIIEAESETQALLVVPSLVRAKATVVRLNKFSEEDVSPSHTSHRAADAH